MQLCEASAQKNSLFSWSQGSRIAVHLSAPQEICGWKNIFCKITHSPGMITTNSIVSHIPCNIQSNKRANLNQPASKIKPWISWMKVWMCHFLTLYDRTLSYKNVKYVLLPQISANLIRTIRTSAKTVILFFCSLTVTAGSLRLICFQNTSKQLAETYCCLGKHNPS